MAIDEEKMSSKLVLENTSPDKPLATFQGNMQLLPPSNVFIGWGSQPFTSEFSHGATQPRVHEHAFLSVCVRREQSLEAYSSKPCEETDLERLGEHLTRVVAETIESSR